MHVDPVRGIIVSAICYLARKSEEAIFIPSTHVSVELSTLGMGLIISSVSDDVDEPEVLDKMMGLARPGCYEECAMEMVRQWYPDPLLNHLI
ncbi:hypothetical protein Ocin01_08452 [Orchesella cincta]|uniref:Uncharacterized protein n=1 Tax=Orchesella cincta TaxID=48709 RepID=A0A1D2MYY9_ORCCI|nr:hypothetical protein Ocin01_08452 [Orchesella cincta]